MTTFDGDAAGTYDYIVVGAGTAGCAVASRLSEDPSKSVLLVEAGGSDRNLWIHIPAGYYRTIFNPKYSWQFKTEPQPSLNGRQLNWPRGKVLGGSGAINGLVYVRGQDRDFDFWRDLGNPGWGYDDVLPFFRKAENQERGPDDYHGAGGPIGISDMRDPRSVCNAFVEAGVQLGIPRTDDFNGLRQEGIGLYQLTVWNGRRSTPANYVRNARHRKNLTLLLNHSVRKVIVENGAATGIEVTDRDDRAQRIRSRETILSAGTVGSPVILQHSGIGDGDVLARAGVQVAHHLPGVGGNLSDRLQIRCIFEATVRETINDVYNSIGKRAWAAVKYALNRSGPLSIGAGQAAAFVKSVPSEPSPDLEIIFMGFSATGPGSSPHPFPGFTILGYPLRPRSRGTIHITSPDIAAPPKIDPRYLTDPYDQEMTVKALELCLEIARQPALKGFLKRIHEPTQPIENATVAMEYIREKATTVFHPVGTCRMGANPASGDVVDARLRVHGIGGLRVVDASIMPQVVSGNTNAATGMIGERGAALIIEDATRA